LLGSSMLCSQGLFPTKLKSLILASRSPAPIPEA
jgi:hypothetical protein